MTKQLLSHRTYRNWLPPRWPRFWEGRPEPQTRVYGPALVDSTRLALSSFDIWGDIFDTNRDAIRLALESYIAKLEEFQTALNGPLDGSSLRRGFDAGSRFAARLRDVT